MFQAKKIYIIRLFLFFMIESAFKIAYTQILGISLITYLAAINFVLILAAFILGIAASRGKANPITHETVAYFAVFFTLINGILGLLLLL